MGFLIGLLIGAGIGLIIMPIILWIYVKIKVVLMRRNIKRMIKQNKFLKPVDSRDYDTESWKDKINQQENDLVMADLDDKLFKRNKYKPDAI